MSWKGCRSASLNRNNHTLYVRLHKNDIIFYKWAKRGIGISPCECRDNTLSSCFSLWHLKRPTGAVESDCVVIFHLGILLQSCNCLISLLIRRLAFTDRVACSVVMRVIQIKWEVMGAWFHNFAVHKGVTNHSKICGIAACFTSEDDVRLFSELPRTRIGVGDVERSLEPGDDSLSRGSKIPPGLNVACMIPCCSGRLEEMTEQTVPETLLTQLWTVFHLVWILYSYLFPGICRWCACTLSSLQLHT